MKKVMVFFTMLAIFIAATGVLFAGGMQENTNQSVEYLMTQSRNASTDADATYFNPAGTALMEDGLYIYLSDQLIYQPVTVESDYAYLNDGKYEGYKAAWYFPDLYLVFKKWDMAFSFGAMGLGGGGTAKFDDGLPSFEIDFAAQTAQSMGLGDEVGDMMDRVVGGDGTGTILDLIYGAGTHATLNGGYGAVNGYSTSAEFEGSSSYYSFMLNYAYSINKIFAISAGYRFIYGYNTYKGSLSNTINSVGGPGGTAYTIATQKVDVKQTGMAHGIIVGMSFKPIEGLTIGTKFSWCSPLILKNDTKDDITLSPMFPDGEKTRHTLPMQLSWGFDYEIQKGVVKGLGITSSVNVFLNKDTKWADNKHNLVDTGYEVGVGVYYTLQMIPLKIAVSYGWGDDGVTDASQTSEISEDAMWHSVGGGLSYEIIKGLDLTLAYMYTHYIVPDINGTTSNGVSYTSTYDKKSHAVGIGIGYKIL